MTKLDQTKINDIIKTFIQETLDFDEEVRTNRKGPFSLEEIDQRADFIGSLRAEKQEDLAKRDYRSAASAVDTVIQNHGLKFTKGSEDYNRLSREVLKAEIAMLVVEQKRTLGNYSSPQKAALRASIEPYHRSDGNQGQKSASEQPQQNSATIKQAGDDFWNEFNHGWKPRSRTDYKNVIEQIVEGFGPETQLHTIDYNRVKEFRQGLRDGSLTKYGKPLSIARVNLFMATTQRIFDLAMKQDKHLDRINPADGLQLIATVSLVDYGRVDVSQYSGHPVRAFTGS